MPRISLVWIIFLTVETMLSCKETIQLIIKSMDQPLRIKDWFGVWFHTFMCRYCFRFKKQIKWLRFICNNESKALENDLILTDSLSPEARKRITKKISEHMK